MPFLRLGVLRVKMLRLGIVALLATALASAQALPQFEVATFKQSPPPAGDLININLGTVRNGRLTFANASLSDLLKFAWSLSSNEQLEGPDWISTRLVRFDVEAKAPPDTPREQLALMLQSLLAERLKLAVHHEQRTRSYLALVVGKQGGKKGPKLADPDSHSSNPSARGHIQATHMSMPMLAMLLSLFERETIVDRTGISGEHQFRLEWTPNDVVSAGAETPAGPSIYTALEEQLGLKLESRKGPLDVLVIDHAEKTPADN